jgi:hypothetical protein
MALAYGWAPADVWPLTLSELADWVGRAERVLKARAG